MPSTVRHEAAAIVVPGLEAVCEQELRALRLKPRPGQSGVVPFRANNRQLYAANLWLRTASRILVRVASFRATDFAHLQQRAAEVDFSPYLADDHRPEFRVTARSSGLYHTDAVAQRLHQVVGPPSIGEPVQPFVVRIDRDIVTISADASGTPLGHRAWRTELGVAPLRPTMAAAVLLAAGWDGTMPLVDPFCGSGTIPIEAALIAAGRPPGGDRTFAFQAWPGFEPGAWASVEGEASQRARPISVSIEATDRDPAAADRTRRNADRAGVGDAIETESRVVSHLPGRIGTGLVATNPPYGKRVGDGDLRPLYRRFGAVLRDRRPGWDLVVVAADTRLGADIDARLRPLAGFGHGGLRVSVLSRPGRTGDETRPGDEDRDDPRSAATS